MMLRAKFKTTSLPATDGMGHAYITHMLARRLPQVLQNSYT